MLNDWTPDRPGEGKCMDCGALIGWVLTEDGFTYHPAYLRRDGNYRHAAVVCKDC